MAYESFGHRRLTDLQGNGVLTDNFLGFIDWNDGIW